MTALLVLLAGFGSLIFSIRGFWIAYRLRCEAREIHDETAELFDKIAVETEKNRKARDDAVFYLEEANKLMAQVSDVYDIAHQLYAGNAKEVGDA